MDDAVDGALRRGGRTTGRRKPPKRGRARAPSSGPAKKPKFTLASFMPMNRRTPFARPTTLYTSRQLAAKHIADASSGRTARMPMFAGTKPTKFAIRRGGRAAKAGRFGGEFVSFTDAYELQRTLQQEKAEQQAQKEMSEMRAAVTKTLKAQGLPHLVTEEEAQAAKLKAERIAQDKSTKQMEEDIKKYIDKQMAEAKLPQDVRDKLEKMGADMANFETKEDALKAMQRINEVTGRTEELDKILAKNIKDSGLREQEQKRGRLAQAQEFMNYRTKVERDILELQAAAEAGERARVLQLKEMKDELKKRDAEFADQLEAAESRAKLEARADRDKDREEAVKMKEDLTYFQTRLEDVRATTDKKKRLEELKELLKEAEGQTGPMLGVQTEMDRITKELKDTRDSLEQMRKERVTKEELETTKRELQDEQSKLSKDAEMGIITERDRQQERIDKLSKDLQDLTEQKRRDQQEQDLEARIAAERGEGTSMAEDAPSVPSKRRRKVAVVRKQEGE